MCVGKLLEHNVLWNASTRYHALEDAFTCRHVQSQKHFLLSGASFSFFFFFLFSIYNMRCQHTVYWRHQASGFATFGSGKTQTKTGQVGLTRIDPIRAWRIRMPPVQMIQPNQLRVSWSTSVDPIYGPVLIQFMAWSSQKQFLRFEAQLAPFRIRTTKLARSTNFQRSTNGTPIIARKPKMEHSIWKSNFRQRKFVASYLDRVNPDR